MNDLDFTKEFWADVQFRVKTLEELEEFYGCKLKQEFRDLKGKQTFVEEMFNSMGKTFQTSEDVILLWMGIIPEIQIFEFPKNYHYVREWITHNKINNNET